MKTQNILLTLMTVPLLALAGEFTHDLKGIKPWTNEQFLNDPQEFHFAIVPDRTGGERKGVFTKALDTLNLLRPEFVMTVGDLIPCSGDADVEKQWDELERMVARLQMPFFYVVGNHDIQTGMTGMTPARKRSIEVWKARHGERTYYDFLYKGCHFVCLDSMEVHDYYPPREALSQSQVDWAYDTFVRNKDARWHFIFMHKPLDWTSDRWLAFERKINKYNYTVFCGDWHNHCTATRHGKKYHMIGTAGGGWDLGVTCRDMRYGIVDTVTWVTMTKKGPVVSNIEIDAIHGDTLQTCATTQGWIESPLDYPSHRQAPASRYAGERNTTMIPTEIMQGDGYDWHFRHAIWNREGLVYAAGLQKFKAGKRQAILLGDETASAHAANFDEGWQVFDMGFKGERIENTLWRVIEGTLDHFKPDCVVVSVGAHNREKNSEADISAGFANLVNHVRAKAPKAELRTFPCGQKASAAALTR